MDSLAQVSCSENSQITHSRIILSLHPPPRSSPAQFPSPLSSIPHTMFSARQIFAQVQRRGFSASARQVRARWMGPLLLLERFGLSDG